MTGTEHDELGELAALYAIDALVGDELRSFEEHHAQCPACQAEVASFQDVASHLIVDEVPPPPAMRDSVLSAIGEIEQEAAPLSSSRASSADAAAAPVPTADGGRITDIRAGTGRRRAEEHPAEPSESRPAQPDRPERTDDDEGSAPGPIPLSGHRRFGGRAVAGVAAVAVAATIAVFAVVERPWEPEDPAQQIVAAEDTEHFDATVAGDGEVDVFVSAGMEQAALEAEGLEAPPEGHVYQAWWLREGGKESAGVFTADTFDGDPQLLEGAPGGATGVALTIEPEGGSEQPTTDPTYVVELS